MNDTYQVGYEVWDECEQIGAKYHDYASALEEACRWLCDSAMLYVNEGYAVANVYHNGKRVWSESVGIDR